jgi:hypothetical protein
MDRRERLWIRSAACSSGPQPKRRGRAAAIDADIPADTLSYVLVSGPSGATVGHRSKEIADQLGIGVGAVNTYVRHIYDKLHVRSRAEAVARLPGRP